MRLRSIVRKAAKPLVMTGVSMGLAVSLVVGGSNQAHASVILPPPILLGSGAMPVADALALVAPTGPIGWTIAGVAVVGIAAYATKDYWLPYVTGSFGQPQGQQTVTDTTYVNPLSGVTTDFIQVNADQSFQTTIHNNNGSTQDIYFTQYRQCKNTSTGALTLSMFNGSGSRVANGGTILVKYSACASGSTLVGAAVEPPCKIPPGVTGVAPCTTRGQPGPTVSAEWGSFSGVTSFNPKTSATSYSAAVECIRADGSKFTITKTSTGDQGAIGIPACAAVDPGSHSSGKTDITGIPPAASGAAPSVIYSVPAVPTATGYEQCATSKPGPGCVLSVLVDGKPCVVGQWECAHWTDLRNDPNQVNRLSCQYGPYSVTMDKCNVLERAYELGGAPATSANIDGDPSTRSDTDPNGQQVPKTDPSTSTGTGTGTGLDPSTMPGAAGSPSSTDANAQECFPGGWAMLNPMWIVDGIRCSFVPKKDIQTRVTTLRDTAQTKAPISWLMAAPSAPGGGGCPDWTLHVGAFSWSAVCDSTFTQAIVGSRGLIFGMLSVAMVWPLIRSLWYAAIPILRVTPTGGK